MGLNLCRNLQEILMHACFAFTNNTYKFMEETTLISNDPYISKSLGQVWWQRKSRFMTRSNIIGIETDFKIFCFKIVSILGNINAWGILCQFHPLKHWWVSKILIYPRAYTKEPSSFKKMSFLYVCIVFQKRQLAKYNSQQGCIGVKF